MRNIRLPAHVAFIMDGNGRWAKKHFRSRGYGHKMGVQNMIKLCSHAFKLGVKIVTVYALSTENLSRPQEELDGIYDLFRSYFQKQKGKIQELGVRVNVMGDLTPLPEDVRGLLLETMRDTAVNVPNGLLNLCINYGARQEIIQAVNHAVAFGRFVDENSFKSLLYSAGMPDPDLIIRTGGEVRLSNFLLYQAAYTELYFSNKMWPEFSRRDLEKALVNYSQRDRRFGNVKKG